MKHCAHIALTLLIFTAITSCSGVEKVLKSNDFDAKYEIAMKYYNQNSYSRASQIFENLQLYYRGKEHAENIAWYYAQCQLKAHDYYSAAYQFRAFVRQYPYSEHAEEALFLSAFCKYKDSPIHSLDQTLTKEAIADFETFVERYPRSTHIPEINSYLDEMRDKLMRKDYEIAYNYYHIEAYHAAYLSLQSFVNYYPESPLCEDALYYQLCSGYEYAIHSREEKMKERLQQVLNDFEKFAVKYQDSKYLGSAQSLYTKARARLTEIETAEAKGIQK